MIKITNINFHEPDKSADLVLCDDDWLRLHNAREQCDIISFPPGVTFVNFNESELPELLINDFIHEMRELISTGQEEIAFIISARGHTKRILQYSRDRHSMIMDITYQ